MGEKVLYFHALNDFSLLISVPRLIVEGSNIGPSMLKHSFLEVDLPGVCGQCLKALGLEHKATFTSH